MTGHRGRALSAIAATAHLIALVACAPSQAPTPAAPATAPAAEGRSDPNAPKVGERDARCFTIERPASPRGGLSIPGQIVCPLVPPAGSERQ